LRHPRLADQLVDGRHRQPSPSVSGRSIPVFEAAYPSKARRKSLLHAPPRAQSGKTAIRARPRTDVFRHRGPRHRHLRRRRGHALTSDSSVSEAAFELHSSRPECPAIPPKELVFQRLFAERPFRRAKFTACRKKVCVFIGAVARSQGRLAQNPAKSQYARALPQYTQERKWIFEARIASTCLSAFCRRHSVLRTKCRQAGSKGRSPPSPPASAMSAPISTSSVAGSAIAPPIEFTTTQVMR
jgi:hypothetical protein